MEAKNIAKAGEGKREEMGKGLAEDFILPLPQVPMWNSPEVVLGT